MMRVSSTKKPRRRYNCHGQPEYPTATFPDNVITKIFSYLPIEKNVQAGLSAKGFTSSWMHIRDLHFKRAIANRLDGDQFRYTINKMVLAHEGNINSFALFFNQTGHDQMVEAWIKKCIDQNVRELDLDFLRSNKYFEIPTFLYETKSLHFLRLTRCCIELPLKMQGWHLLHTLVLKNVKISTKSIKTLCDICFSLEKLVMVECHKIGTLLICTKLLKWFKILKILRCNKLTRLFVESHTMSTFNFIGAIPERYFLGANNLDDLMLYDTSKRDPNELSPFTSIVHDISHISILTTSAIYLQFLCPRFGGDAFKEPKYTFNHVKELQLFMKGGFFNSPFDVMLFVGRCPVLEKLFIDFSGYSFLDAQEIFKKGKFEDSHYHFYRLKFIKVRGFNFQPFELMILPNLLERSPMLEELVIVLPKSGQAGVHLNLQYYYQSLLQYRSSKKANVIFCPDFNDKKFPNPTHQMNQRY